MVVLVGCSYNHNGMGGYSPSPDMYYRPSGNPGEEYKEITENDFVSTTEDPIATFSLDTSTAGYANLRRLINNNNSIHKNQVKLEEMVNYFSYDYEAPSDDEALTISSEIMDCPWDLDHKLLTIGVKAKPVVNPQTKNNIVLLLDVSGSMASPNKLPLMQEAFKLFVETLDGDDTVSIVTYASSNRIALEGASGADKKLIINVIEDLMAGGSTAGSKGIQTAYQLASKYFIEDGNNRVILGTDGDFNVGISSTSALKNFIAEKRQTGVYLSVLGFGYGNLKDDKLSTLAQAGNGNHAY
jgi:Ca-activated chloride channel family protein